MKKHANNMVFDAQVQAYFLKIY